MELRRSCYLIAAPADLPSGRVLVVTLLYISSDDFSIEFKVEDTKHVIKSFMRSKLISWYVLYMERSLSLWSLVIVSPPPRVLSSVMRMM